MLHCCIPIKGAARRQAKRSSRRLLRSFGLVRRCVILMVAWWTRRRLHAACCIFYAAPRVNGKFPLRIPLRRIRTFPISIYPLDCTHLRHQPTSQPSIVYHSHSVLRRGRSCARAFKSNPFTNQHLRLTPGPCHLFLSAQYSPLRIVTPVTHPRCPLKIQTCRWRATERLRMCPMEMARWR